MRRFLGKIRAAFAAVAFAETGLFDAARSILNEDIDLSYKIGAVKILLVYNGTVNAKAALRYAISRARAHQAVLVVLFVFHRDLFIDYDAGPGAEEVARKEWALQREEALRILDAEGQDIRKRLVVTDGNWDEEILATARQERVDIIFSPQRLPEIAKKSFCPVYFIPSAHLAAGAL
jgi:nucleotide-binding universal stress UspA family protein